ncbi:MAG TPA: hypothetical protein VHB20_11320 [Verrucomicrobiae bacterium]|jgi:hypothetical protein|nr:hypothetical protein [Verrucomicrobiae bacterium]
MIQLRADCLIFETSDGENVPCTADWVTLELLGEGADMIDPQIIHHASAAVLHYFKFELNRQHVSVGEFAAALEKVLRQFGLSVYADSGAIMEPPKPPQRALVADLRVLAVGADKGYELFFFPQLREELKRHLEKSPEVLRFEGLRGCVKQLTGAQRWSRRCDRLADQIVEYLRQCWQSESNRAACSLVVQ